MSDESFENDAWVYTRVTIRDLEGYYNIGALIIRIGFGVFSSFASGVHALSLLAHAGIITFPRHITKSPFSCSGLLSPKMQCRGVEN